jgi:hypothetical protein
MAIVKSVAPQNIAFIQNMTPNDVTYIQDAPQSVDALNITTINATLTPLIDVDFGDFGGTLVGNVEIQFVYEDPNWIGAHVEMLENGTKKYESAVTYNGYSNKVVSFLFDSALLADNTGKNMLIRFVGHVYAGKTISYLKALRVVVNVEPPVIPNPFLEAKTDWLPIDYYNFEALNRVELMIKTLAPKIEEYRKTTITLQPFTLDRTEQTIETASSLYRIETNILNLADVLGWPTGFVTPKLGWTYNSPFSYEDANRLEKNLVILDNYVVSQLNAQHYCGQYIAGEEGVR